MRVALQCDQRVRAANGAALDVAAGAVALADPGATVEAIRVQADLPDCFFKGRRPADGLGIRSWQSGRMGMSHEMKAETTRTAPGVKPAARPTSRIPPTTRRQQSRADMPPLYGVVRAPP